MARISILFFVGLITTFVPAGPKPAPFKFSPQISKIPATPAG